MYKMTKEEFLDELTIELAGYEEISNENIDHYIEAVDKYIEKNKGKDKKISVTRGDIMIKLDDESDIFMMVDRFLVAVVNNETDLYWKDWRL